MLILRNIFVMGTTKRLVRESPDELEQLYFNEMSMKLTPISMVVTTVLLHYFIKILFGLIKAYDSVQRDQFMAILDEK